jgi:hypothetical protein
MPTPREYKVFAISGFQETAEENISFEHTRKRVFTDKCAVHMKREALKHHRNSAVVNFIFKFIP